MCYNLDVVMTWFEFAGAYASNLHTVALVLAVFASLITLATVVGGIMSAEEYSEIEFMALAKTFGLVAIIMWILSCAPTPPDMRTFSEDVATQKSITDSERQAYMAKKMDVMIPEMLKAPPGDGK
jgi:hypothetical protein